MLAKNEKDKVNNLFQFLKQYNNIKNPTITDINLQQWKWVIDDIPVHKNIKSNVKSDEDTDEILTVSKPQFNECPEPPEELLEWIEKDWNRFNERLKVKDSISKLSYNVETEQDDLIEIKFDDNKERVQVLEKWKVKRDIWIQEEILSHKVDDIFNSLYSLYSTLKKESESVELVFGDGILGYLGEKKIYHPVILQKVNLVFDANVAEFKIEISDKNPELYKSLFTLIPDSNMELLIDIYKEFEEEEFSPLNIDNTNSFFLLNLQIMNSLLLLDI